MLFLQSHVNRIVKVPKEYFWKRLRAFDKIQTLLPKTIKEVKIPDNFSNSPGDVRYVYLEKVYQGEVIERLDGFIGRQDAYTRKITDRYISATSRDRFAYQLEPAVTYTDKDTTSINPEDQVKFTGTYDDYINQIKY